jgi:hypothetical protein
MSFSFQTCLHSAHLAFIRKNLTKLLSGNLRQNYDVFLRNAKAKPSFLCKNDLPADKYCRITAHFFTFLKEKQVKV